MPTNRIILIEGLGKPGTSPIDPLGARLFNALPVGVGIALAHWEEVEAAGASIVDPRTIDADSKLLFVGHSLGGYAAIWLAARIPAVPVHLILLDPVPGDPQHPWMQLYSDQLTLGANVTSCTCYLRTMFTWVWPWHRGLAFEDGRDFVNVQVPWADHNSIVEKTAGDVVSFATGLFSSTEGQS